MSHNLSPFLLGIGFSLFAINLTTAYAVESAESTSSSGVTTHLHHITELQESDPTKREFVNRVDTAATVIREHYIERIVEAGNEDYDKLEAKHKLACEALKHLTNLLRLVDLVSRVLEDGNTQGVLNLEILWNRSHANLIERGFTEEELQGIHHFTAFIGNEAKEIPHETHALGKAYNTLNQMISDIIGRKIKLTDMTNAPLSR